MPTATVEEDEAFGLEQDPASAIAQEAPAKELFLTIPQAKEGLAATLGVSIDKIEITIKA